MNCHLKKFQCSRSGLSLLEVVLAIAILGISMVAIVELLNVGYRAAISGRLRTEAALLCDAKMSEIAAGVLPVQSSGMSSLPENPNWNFAVDVQPSVQLGLLSVTVTVQQSLNSASPISMSVVRFMPDPDFNPDEVP